jgi:anti-sigma factor RsiW
MTGLTHEQTKKFLNAAADQCLNPIDRAAMNAHLADCTQCRTYGQELEQLNGAIGRALRMKWSAPYRSPIDMAGRVRKQLRVSAERQLFLGVTNVLVKLGSMAVGTALVLSLFTSQQTLQNPVVASSAATTTSLFSGLSKFEIRDMQEGLAPPSLINSDNQAGTPASRWRALPY